MCGEETGIVHGLQDSMVVGLIIVERCRVAPESKGGNRNAFKLSERRRRKTCLLGVLIWEGELCRHVSCVYSVREYTMYIHSS